MAMLGVEASGERGRYRLLRRGDLDYPLALRRLSSPPDVLYMAGALAPEDVAAVAIVGSRATMAAEEHQAFEISRGLAEHGYTIVSGLARGIDAAAHRGALAVPSGRTVAVVATGLDRSYPPENAELDRTIRRRGAVLSLWPPEAAAERAHFLARNRVIAGLALATLVVAGDEHSGTHNTIRHTQAMQRPVVLWAPTMHAESWARNLARSPLAYFADDIEQVLRIVRGDEWTRPTSGG